MSKPSRRRVPHRNPRAEPSHKEINGKLKLFKEQLANDAVLLADAEKFERDRQLLGLDTTEEGWELLNAMSVEIQPEHYCPPHVRKTSYELEGAPMYDFAWHSAHRAEAMYVKFAVADGQSYLVSCHPDNPRT